MKIQQNHKLPKRLKRRLAVVLKVNLMNMGAKRVVFAEIHTPIEEDESSKEEDELQNAKKKDANVEMVDASSAKKAPQTRAAPQTSFMGNLTFTIEESNVTTFFKDAAEVVEVCFAIRDDRFAGYMHVEFATREAAQEALEVNGKPLLDHPVKLDLAK